MHGTFSIISYHHFLMTKTIYLEDIPEKIMTFILQEQSEAKIKNDVKLNQSKTVIKMLRDYKRCKEQNNFQGDN